MGHGQAVDLPGKRGGNKRTVDVREVVNGIMYILSTGSQWAALPKDLPPRSTVWISGWAALSDQFEEGGFKQSGQGRMRGLAVPDNVLEDKLAAFVSAAAGRAA